MLKWIPGYRGYYKASSRGYIKSVVRVVTRVQNSKTVYQRVRARILKTGKDAKTGYLSVMLCKKGVPKRYLVHQLVCLTFHGPAPTPKHEVNHMGEDGDKTNNRADNLEWVTRKQNQQHAYAVGLHGWAKHGNPSKRQ